MMMIGSSVDYVRSGGMRNVPVTKAVEHLYAATTKFSGCGLLASRPAYSYPPRRLLCVIASCVVSYNCMRICEPPADCLQMALPSRVTSEHQAAENRRREGRRS
ncbi:hypothetical protein AVEN_192773-1 [Araneus ventricosus]|uniref:Uncharacterized protein n=1 Tax=Araneus ventricosus TaxID=182803 RepID=A0A4Y2NQQ3_ARAVE|nr:hypothetical protein AVEN_192773-1 [Araneus ventricosus]